MFRPKNGGNKKLKVAMFLVIFTAIAMTPVFVLSDHKDDLYVNADAHGYEDGSSRHPYNTIGAAISEADDGTQIHVAKGTYKENIELKKDIKLFGDDNNDVIIKAKKGKWATVTMEDNSGINGVTIKDGQRGIWVGSHAKASISNCIIRDNKEDGIAIEGKSTDKSDAVTISNSEIKDNGMSGIYSTGPRRVVIVNSDIHNNNLSGISLAKGTSAWIGGNDIQDNKLGGVKLVLDGSDIWTKGNQVRENKLDGFEILAFGGAGRINIEKTKIVQNGHYAISKLAKSPAALGSAYWNSNVTFSGLPNNIWGNLLGGISGIISAR